MGSNCSPPGQHSRLSSNAWDISYNVLAHTNDDTICGYQENSFVFELHLKPFHHKRPRWAASHYIGAKIENWARNLKLTSYPSLGTLKSHTKFQPHWRSSRGCAGPSKILDVTETFDLAWRPLNDLHWSWNFVCDFRVPNGNYDVSFKFLAQFLIFTPM